MADFLIEELKREIHGAKRPLVICGAGVSMQATSGKAPSWAKLIENGIQRAVDLGVAHATWAAYARHRLGSGGADEWIAVADELTSLLGTQRGREFSQWLEAQIAPLASNENFLLATLVDLQSPLATTNYDDILTAYTGLPAILWNDYAQVAAFLKDERSGVLYLHGHWRQPETVILGSSSYENLTTEPRRNLLQQLAGLTRPTLFVGCSADGLADPDFAKFDQFIRDWSGSAERRYWLITEEAASTIDRVAYLAKNVIPIVYGSEHGDLPGFLQRLTGRSSPGSPPASPSHAIQCVDESQPRPRLFGRDGKIREIVRSILDGQHVIISGAPGIGKTALAVAALYEDEIQRGFGLSRVFVSLEGLEDPRNVVVQLTSTLGLDPAGDIPSLLRRVEGFTTESPVVAILDNAEDVFDADFDSAQHLLQLLAQRRGLTLLLTLRGASPTLVESYVISDLEPLDEPASKSAFVAVAQGEFGDDPRLGELLRELDGHPLSIELIAARAREIGDLGEVRRLWDIEKAKVLERQGAKATRLTSVRASLGLSLQSKSLQRTPAALPVIAVLSVLPDGVDADSVRRLIGSPADFGRNKVASAIVALRELRLTERRKDGVVRMLNPLRESARLDVPLTTAIRKRLRQHYLSLAVKGELVATEAWRGVSEVLGREFANIDAVCRIEQESGNISPEFLRAALGLIKSVDATGREIPRWSDDLIASLIHKGNYIDAANFMNSASSVYYDRRELAKSERYRKEVILHLRRFGPSNALADAYFGLGAIAIDYSSHADATSNLATALDMFRLVGNTTGIGAVLYHLANLAYRTGNREVALQLVKESEEKYSAGHNLLGQANCRVLRSQIGVPDAGDLLREVIAQVSGAGVPATESNAYNLLGDRAIRAGDLPEALRMFDLGGSIAKNGRSLGNEAHATIMSGMCLKAIGETEKGIHLVQLGFSLWFESLTEQDAARLGWEEIRQAYLTSDPVEAASHREAAKIAWTKVGRQDLVTDWVGLSLI